MESIWKKKERPGLKFLRKKYNPTYTNEDYSHICMYSDLVSILQILSGKKQAHMKKYLSLFVTINVQTGMFFSERSFCENENKKDTFDSHDI